MPLVSGEKARTEAGFQHNLKAELEAGKPKKQALAIAYAKARDEEVATNRQPDINGFIEIKANPISKVGVFQYLGAQIDPDGVAGLERDKIYNVYRPEEELSSPETLDSFRLLPWTDEHAMLGNPKDGLTAPEDMGVQGVIGEDVFFEDGYLKANIKIFSTQLGELIDSGKKELSIGYRCLYDITAGEYNGIEYDAIQRQIRGNHVALVEEGRSGHDVAVLDQFKFTFDTKGLEMTDNRPDDVIDEDDVLELKDVVEMIKELKRGHEEILNRLKVEGEVEDDAEEDLDDAKQDLDDAEQDLDDARKDIEEAKSDVEDEDEEKERITMDSLKAIVTHIDERNSLAKRLSKHIGVFDHASMTLKDVAKYGVKKLKLPAAKGSELAMVEGYLRGARVSAPLMAQDSKRDIGDSSCVDAYLNGGN